MEEEDSFSTEGLIIKSLNCFGKWLMVHGVGIDKQGWIEDNTQSG